MRSAPRWRHRIDVADWPRQRLPRLRLDASLVTPCCLGHLPPVLVALWDAVSKPLPLLQQPHHTRNPSNRQSDNDNEKQQKRCNNIVSGYVGRVTTFRWLLTSECCSVLVGLLLRLVLDLVSCWLMVAHMYLFCFLLSLSLSPSYMHPLIRTFLSRSRVNPIKDVDPRWSPRYVALRTVDATVQWPYQRNLYARLVAVADV